MSYKSVPRQLLDVFETSPSLVCIDYFQSRSSFFSSSGESTLLIGKPRVFFQRSLPMLVTASYTSCQLPREYDLPKNVPHIKLGVLYDGSETIIKCVKQLYGSVVFPRHNPSPKETVRETLDELFRNKEIGDTLVDLESFCDPYTPLANLFAIFEDSSFLDDLTQKLLLRQTQ